MQRLTRDDLRGMRVGVWDVESCSLNASFGHLLAVAFLPLWGRKSEVVWADISQFPEYTERGIWDDSGLVRWAIQTANQSYDVLVGYNTLNFDVPILNTRALTVGGKGGLWLRRDIRHVDLYRWVRAQLRMSSRSLDTLITQLQSRNKKTHVAPFLWRKAMCGDKSALHYVVTHNIRDVLSLAEVTRKILDHTWVPYFYKR